MLLIKTGLLYFLYLLQYGSALECLLCNDAASITECLNQPITCGSGEQCFLERSTRASDLKAVLNGGCRSNTVCRIMGTLIGKRSLSPRNSLLGCSECCHSLSDDLGPCNAKLCGQRPLDTTIRCLSCLNKASATGCSSRQVCQPTQVCANEIVVEGGNLIRFNFYCEEKHLCQAEYSQLATAVHGRRREQGHSSGVIICRSCCIGNECNKADCYKLRNSYNSSSFASVASTSHG